MQIWHDIASHLKSGTVGELKERMSSSEFLRWKVYLDEEWNRHTKQDHYLAQIAREVATVLVRKKSSIKLEPFLMKFKFTKPGKKREVEVTEEEQKRRALTSKSFWLGLLGIKPPKDNP